MYRKILVPVTDPQTVAPLVRLASYLIEPTGEIRVLHVIPSRSMVEVTKGWRASLKLVIPAHEAGAAMDVDVVPEVKVASDVAVEILERAESEKADAILMTLRGSGRKRGRNPFLGHTSTAVLHHATSDVLIVNSLALSADHVGKIMIPTLTIRPPEKARMAAESISTKMGGASIVTLHLREGQPGTAPEDTDHTIRHPSHHIPTRLKTILFPHRLFGTRAALPQAILEVLRKEGYGLCLIAEEGRGTEAPLLNRTFIEELFSRAPCPMLVLKG